MEKYNYTLSSGNIKKRMVYAKDNIFYGRSLFTGHLPTH